MFSHFKKIIIVIFSFVATQSLNAQILGTAVKDDIRKQTEAMSASADISTGSTVGSVLAVVIKAFFSVMGMVFLILILHAGYKWMNASGDSKQVDEAKDSIKRAVIGLAVMIAAYAITAFVFKQISLVQ